MEKVQILVLCSNAEILPILIRLIDNNHAWKATGAPGVDEALALCDQQLFDLVLLGSGMDMATERTLRPAFTTVNPKVKFIQHYGGGSGLLSAEIMGALAR